MNKIFLSIFMMIQWLFFANVFSSSNKPITITGTVTDEKGEPLIYANVYFPDDLSGDVTDRNGRFEILTQWPGKRELVVTFIGYQKHVQTIDIKPENTENLMIQMTEQAIGTQKVTVTASSFTLSDEEGTTLSAMDVVSTAGAAADIMRAIQTFPGVVSIDEGAGLFVRGGDKHETRTLIDGMMVERPYTAKNSDFPVRSRFSPMLFNVKMFSTGGYYA